jgi:hypothetical protein
MFLPLNANTAPFVRISSEDVNLVIFYAALDTIDDNLNNPHCKDLSLKRKEVTYYHHNKPQSFLNILNSKHSKLI